MKITQKEMWESLDRIIHPWYPMLITCKDLGYTLPKALEVAAVHMVRDDRDNYYSLKNPHERCFDEQNVIDALREINHNGFINFIDTKENE